uniref:PHD finger protein 21A n=1 Tax=Phallusia mammillata TaxID=59560 RepID=A0A6F9DNR7_9ASCI|nr:PHD finger protein 21A [Phallusia mammillata]
MASNNSKGTEMDLKIVQQQLKADIMKHQEIMVKLKKMPQDSLLLANLKEIQKHIAELGSKQKQLKIQYQNHVQESPVVTNGEVPGVSARKFVKIAPKKEEEPQKQLLGKVVDVTEHGSFTPVTLKQAQAAENKIGNLSSSNSVAICSSFRPINLTKVNGVSSTNKRSIQSKADVTQVSSAQNALNLSTKSKMPVSTNSPRNIIMHAPMKIKVPGPPMATTASYVLLATNVTNSKKNPTVLRLVQKGQNVGGAVAITASQGKLMTHQKPVTTSNKAHVWLNVSNSSNIKRPPTAVTQSRPKQQAPSTFQKCRILDGKVVSTGNPLPTNYIQSNKPKQPPVVRPTTSPVSMTTTSNDICDTQPIDPMNKKLYFLDVLDLVPKEKADRLRNRRYGKRRSVAHPVYSGGIYVSTTGTDSSKRILPPDLLGFEEMPVKRPRGRPRGSGKNANRSIPPSTGAVTSVNKEVSKIIEQTRPDRPSTSRGFVSRSLEQKGTDQKGDSHEDHCAVCNETGKLLMCDTCSFVYHMDCLDPPLKVVPTGMWYCDTCRKKFSDNSAAPRWPGLMSVVHSYLAFDRQRREAIESARKKAENLKQQRSSRQHQIKTMAADLITKVTAKNRSLERNRHIIDDLTKLRKGFDSIRNGVVKFESTKPLQLDQESC